jgi:microcystin-dependent protein
MAEPFIGEIKLISFNFAPKYWAMCQGQLLGINQNLALFSLLGTIFGGNGTTNFALPDLRGRVPVHPSPTHLLGQSGGEQAHTLTVAELPNHSHPIATNNTPGQNLPSPTQHIVNSTGANLYGPANNLLAMSPEAVTRTGSNPHQNLAPYLALNFCICLQGIYPSRP